MHAESYFPSQEGALVLWTSNLAAVSSKYAAELAIPASWIADLQTLSSQFTALYRKCLTHSCTQIERQAKKDTKAALIKKIRAFVRFYLQNNEKMTDEIRVELQIPIHATHYTPHPAPDTVPEIETRTAHPRVVHIRFRGENVPRWGKPRGVHGIECLWVIADKRPKKIEELLHSIFVTKNPLELVFDEDERGKRVYFAVRWESGAAKKGPWSEIFNIFIP
jgi:hypothetical protein